MRNPGHWTKQMGKSAGVTSLMATAVLALSASSPSLISSTSGGPAPVRIETPVRTETIDAGPPVQEVIRVIDDAQLGDRWLLLRDPERPGGPGRLVLDARQSDTQGHAKKDDTQPRESSPVIRAGDALIVEEHTAVVDARLEAIALSSAAKGAEVKARLKIGGRVVWVVALAPGRAILAPENRDSE